MSRRAGAVAALAAWTAGLLAVLAALHGVGGALAPPPLSDPGALGTWLEERQPAEAAVAVVRLVVLGMGWYLLAVTVAGVAARAVGAGGVAAMVDAVTVPAVRRLVHGAVGLSLTVAAVGGPAGGAMADDRPRPPAVAAAETMTRLPDEELPPPTMARLPDRAPEAAPPAPAPPPPASPAGAPTWTVRPGEHFWSVAERVLAEAWGRAPTDADVDPYWRALVDANRSQLRDPENPDLLFPGQVLAVPPAPPPP